MNNFFKNFYELMNKLQQKKNVEENLSRMIRFLEAEITFQSMGIFLKTLEAKNFRLKISRNISHSYAKNTVFKESDNIIADLKDLKPIEFENNEKKLFEKDYSHLLLFPLHNNKIFLGFLFLDRKAGKFAEEDLIKAGLIANLVSIIVELEILREQLNQIRNLDEITGFFTYSAFYEKCEEMYIQMKRYNRPLSLVILKIDDYERIIRTIGKAATDALVRTITQMIKNNIRGTDIMGKLYRDLYGIMMPETDVNKSLSAVKRMDELIKRLPKMENRNFGWGVITQDDRIMDLDDLIAKAREAALESCRKSVYKYTVYQD